MTTATPRTMPYKKNINILPSNVATVQICSVHIQTVDVSVLKLAQAKHVMTAFNSKGRQTISHCGYTFSKIHRTLSFRVVVLQKTAKKCTKIQNAHAEPLFCSLNLLFVGILVAVAIVVC